MPVKIVEIDPERHGEYRSVPCKFEVKSTLHVDQAEGGLGRTLLR